MYAPIGMALAGIDGRWLKVNPALCAILKYSEQELLELKFQSLTHPDDLSNDVPQIIRLLNGEIQLYETEKRYLTKDGDVVWVQMNVSLVRDAQGDPAYFIKQVQDITDRKCAEESLRRSEERFASFMDNLLGYAWIKDQAGAYVYANKKFVDAVGCRMEPGFVLIGKQDDLIMPEGAAQACRRNDLKVLRTGRPVQSLEGYGLAGMRRVLLVSKFPLKLGEDEQTSVAGFAIDVTSRVWAEKALKKSRAKLRALLEVRERMAQDLHDHSIQTLYAVGMDLCECKDLLAAPAGRQKVGLVLHRSVDRINEVIRELRSYLRKKDTSNGKIPDNMAQAIRQMVRQMSESGNIRIKATVQRKAVMALDQMQVAHVFAIIREGLSNIVRHARARQAEVSLVLTPPAICVEIADDGVGGAACQHRRAGQKLGLHNIWARAARMKAGYTLTSPQGGGTRLRIVIPLGSGYGT